MSVSKIIAYDYRQRLAQAVTIGDIESLFRDFFGDRTIDDATIAEILEKISDPDLRDTIKAGIDKELALIRNRLAREAKSAVLKNLETGEIDSGSAYKATDTRIYIPGRSCPEDAQYEIIEADEAQASHLPESGFAINPRYELENERLYHKELASQEKVLANAARLNPDFLLRDSVDANNGAPVIDQNGNVLGGNSRVMSLRKAYQNGGKSVEQYKLALLARAGELGISKAQVEAMRQPILVRRIRNSYEKKELQSLVSALNDTFTDSKTSRMAGKSRGDRLSTGTLMALGAGLQNANTLRDFFDSVDSIPIVKSLIKDGVIQNSDRNALIVSDGLLNSHGKSIMEDALRGRITSSYEVLSRIPGSIAVKIDAIAPFVIIAEVIGGDWNITKNISEAIDILVKYESGNFRRHNDFNGFLYSIDMKTGQSVIDSCSRTSVQLFLLLMNGKKTNLASRFRAFARDATNYSQNSNTFPGMEISAKDSARKNLEIDLT